jgi:hypothetical protein
VGSAPGVCPLSLKLWVLRPGAYPRRSRKTQTLVPWKQIFGLIDNARGRERGRPMESILQCCRELENLGEDQVRARLGQNLYSDAEEEEVAREWLKQKALARAAELQPSKAEKVGVLARRTAGAITTAAEKSNAKASIAIMIAATALIISVLSLLAHLFK